MVDQAELFRIADIILAEGKMPSVRAVRAELSKGGSFSDVGPMFNAWSLSRGFRLRPVKDDVPATLLDDLSKVAARIWSHGRDQGRAMKLNEHDELVEMFDALKVAYVAATAKISALEERLAMQEGNGEEYDAESAPGRRAQAMAFWTGLLQDLSVKMRRQTLDPAGAFDLIDPRVHEQAKLWTKGQEWSPSVLGGKMKGRAEKGKFFEALGSDLYRALGAGQAEPPQASPSAQTPLPVAEAPPEQASSAARPAVEDDADIEGAPRSRPISERDGSVETRETRPMPEPEPTPPPRGPTRHGLSMLRGKPDDDGDGEWHAGMDVARYDLQGKPIPLRGSKPKKGRFDP